MGTRVLRITIGLCVAAAALAYVLPGTSSSFTATTGNSGNAVTAAPDWTAPNVDAFVLQKSAGGSTNTLAPGGGFYVYANVSDSGNPASGVASVNASSADIATVSQAPLHAGSWTVGGTEYHFRTDELTAMSTLTTGSYHYRVDATDAAGNGPGGATGSVDVSADPFSGTSFNAADAAGNTGLPQAGDLISFTFDHTPEPASVLAGWDGSATSVTVKLADGGVYGMSGASDLIGVADDSGNLLGLGYVVLNGDYVGASAVVAFTGSSMVLDGKTITVTLGHPSGPTRDDGKKRIPAWHPGAAVIDGYGTTVTPTVVQSPLAALQF